MHKCIDLSSENEWDDALKGIRHSIFHTREYCKAIQLSGESKIFLYCFEKDDAKIICPLIEKEYVGYKDICTPYGFSGFTGNKDFPDFPKYWDEFSRGKKYVCSYISINPLFQNNSYFSDNDAFSKASLYFIDLNVSLTELFENLNSNRKRQLRNYKKTEAFFTYDKTEITEFLIKNYYDFLKRINASQANYFKTETLKQICSLENTFAVGYKSDEEIISVYIFGYTKYCADCLFNVSVVEGRQYTPFLLWCGIKYFRTKKIPVINLGGGSNTGDNIEQSKIRYGAYGLPFVNLKQIYFQDIYEKLCMEKKVSSDKSGYFPAYRKVIT